MPPAFSESGIYIFRDCVPEIPEAGRPASIFPLFRGAGRKKEKNPPPGVKKNKSGVYYFNFPFLNKQLRKENQHELSVSVLARS